MLDWLQYDFMVRALTATMVLSLSVAPVGAFLVLRRLSLAGEAMAHAIVPGIVIAFVIAGLSAASMIVGGLTAGITVAVLTSLLARRTIIRDQLTDPKFYNQMSTLLNDLIRQKRDDTASYEQFLRDAEALVNRMAHKDPELTVPEVLQGNSEAIVLFNNLATIEATTFQCPEDESEKAAIALQLDHVMRTKAPAGWNTNTKDPRAKEVLNEIHRIMSRDNKATLAIFDIIKNQSGYT